MTKAMRSLAGLFLELGEVKILNPALTVSCFFFILLWSPTDISRTLSLSVSWAAVSTVIFTSTWFHRSQPLNNFFSFHRSTLSLSAPFSPCLMASARHHSSLFPWHHLVFIITPQPTLGSLHSPLIFLYYPQCSNFIYSFPRTYHPSALLCFPNIAIILPLSILSPYCALTSKLFFSLLLVTFSFCLCLPPLPPPIPFFLFGSFYLLTVSRAPVLNSLSKALTSGSIVCPLIKLGHLPSAHFCANTVRRWAPLFSESPRGWLMVQKGSSETQNYQGVLCKETL